MIILADVIDVLPTLSYELSRELVERLPPGYFAADHIIPALELHVAYLETTRKYTIECFGEDEVIPTSQKLIEDEVIPTSQKLIEYEEILTNKKDPDKLRHMKEMVKAIITAYLYELQQTKQKEDAVMQLKTAERLLPCVIKKIRDLLRIWDTCSTRIHTHPVEHKIVPVLGYLAQTIERGETITCHKYAGLSVDEQLHAMDNALMKDAGNINVGCDITSAVIEWSKLQETPVE